MSLHRSLLGAAVGFALASGGTPASVLDVAPPRRRAADAATAAAVREAQRRLVEERTTSASSSSAPRAQVLLYDEAGADVEATEPVKQRHEWPVPCGQDLWSNGSVAVGIVNSGEPDRTPAFPGTSRGGRDAAAPPPRQPRKRCARLLWPHFASARDVVELRAALEHALDGLLHQGIEVSLVPDLASRERLGEQAFRSLERLAERARSSLEKAFLQPGDSLRLVGAIIKRVRLPADAEQLQVSSAHDPFRAHVDRANVAAYEYSALLYLNSAGEDFGGGELAFIDADVDRVIRPRAGSLVGFTSGMENLHRALPLTWGTRHVVGFWFGNASHDADEENFDLSPLRELDLRKLAAANADVARTFAMANYAGVGLPDKAASHAAQSSSLELVAPLLALAACVALVFELARGLWRALARAGASRRTPPLPRADDVRSSDVTCCDDLDASLSSCSASSPRLHLRNVHRAIS